MTAVEDRPITDVVDFFENLEVPEGYRAELLRGEIVMMAGPHLVHNRIVLSLSDQISKDYDRLQVQDVSFPRELSRLIPDLTVVPKGAGSGASLPVEEVTLLVEVVSKTSVDRDYNLKRSIYAAGRVPAYLIADPFRAECLLLTEPFGIGDAADYKTELRVPFGEAMPLDMVDTVLDTSDFGTLAPLKRHPLP
ncbi:Uma2 family endonuclease [Streptomyces montanisoli]|uniref:Uma2 family endonuclease n=1 Tax=Streptomyces montanisoli TaxID=2798581 RepID=A0A940MDT7_9ACTN|nr:Uma2 family endonuclease [Streptomyces montanisoli]MBP0461204.1 Uma2 family endonuclease [Streptomyces montanisoli]